MRCRLKAFPPHAMAALDWTDGCIAVTDDEIEDIWARVPVGTPTEIKE